jgi:hypothetical protein
VAADEFHEASEAGPVTKKLAGKIADLLERSGLDAKDIGKIHRVNAWQGMYAEVVSCEACHGSGGTPEEPCTECHGQPTRRVPRVVDMVGVQLSPSWEEGPRWPVVQQAAPTTIRHRSLKPVARDARVTVLLPDPQIGYRRYENGDLDPMHDEVAMAATLRLIGAIRPDRIINLGDFLDLAEWSSKFVVDPEFVFTTQPALDRAHRYLAEQRAAAGPEAEMDLLGGNHDDRLSLGIVKNAKAALRLRQAETPESWPVLSVPFLLRLDDLGVTYTGAYPAGRIKVAQAHSSQAPLVALHGERLDMAKQAKSERQSTVQGHAHHVSMHAETYEVDGEPVEVESWSIGCLCRTDGAVPSTKGGSDDKGRPFRRHESWQQAIGVVTETEDGWWLEPVRIRNGVAMWNGKRYAA